tara:strand:+ start:518 stop:619 length:102 start_codon:yes stop_codon:yes gene_type:complete
MEWAISETGLTLAAVAVLKIIFIIIAIIDIKRQ